MGEQRKLLQRKSDHGGMTKRLSGQVKGSLDHLIVAIGGLGLDTLRVD